MYYSASLLAEAEVLEKQFGYAETAKLKNPNKRILNVLIKPFIADYDNAEGVIGYIPDTNNPNSMIFIYSVGFEKILNAYYTGKKISLDLLEDLNEYESKQ